MKENYQQFDRELVIYMDNEQINYFVIDCPVEMTDPVFDDVILAMPEYIVYNEKFYQRQGATKSGEVYYREVVESDVPDASAFLLEDEVVNNSV